MSTEKNPYRHSHIYPQEIECAACEWAAAEEAHTMTPDVADVVVVHELRRPDGTVLIRTMATASQGAPYYFWGDDRPVGPVELWQKIGDSEWQMQWEQDWAAS